jgi:hypothetical protein
LRVALFRALLIKIRATPPRTTGFVVIITSHAHGGGIPPWDDAVNARFTGPIDA